MHDSTKGKVVIITGGGRGLGRAMALGLVEAGAKVTITASREGAELEETAADARKYHQAGNHARGQRGGGTPRRSTLPAPGG